MQTDDMPAIPLWINGHAYLTLAPAFLDVRNPASGELLRRTPLCGAPAARQAVAAAQAAVAAWAAQSAAARVALLAALGQALASYAAHFVRLIVEESGKEEALAATEVADAVALLCSPPIGDASGVVAIVGSGAAPLLSSLRLAVPALTAGAALVIRPAPQAPSAIFALAELSARCGFPGGVLNVLHGDDAAVDGLCSAGVRPVLA
ncbi:MAG: aldehyde dehydrogenase [Proteobacteria bacterium]|nr:aldehyde dehydrogenase [Pseudomonadota bacterium]